MKLFVTVMLSYLISVLPMSAQTDNGLADKSWYGNSKKEFVLSSAAQMKGLAELVAEGNSFSGKTIYLHQDIDLTTELWDPVGTSDTPFDGTFDGNGFSILLGNVSPSPYAGLFGVVGKGKIQNLNVSLSTNINASEVFGAVAGFVAEKASVNFCNARGSVSTTDASVVGGVVGASEGKVESCANYCTIISTNASPNVVGGVAGKADGIVAKCHNAASVTGSEICGGIVGQNASSSAELNIWNCYNLGVVMSQSTPQSLNQAIVGGIAGKVENVNIEQCYNNGRVDAYCYKQQAADTQCKAYVGGLVGMGGGKLKDSYNVGDVASRSVSNLSDRLESLSYTYAGGLIGYLIGGAISSIDYCYNAGTVYTYGRGNGRTYINNGGVLGDFATFVPSLTCCYYLENVNQVETEQNDVHDVFLKDVGVKVNDAELSSVSFLGTSSDVKSLNDDGVFVHDAGFVNKGYPICQMVHTFALTRIGDGGKAVLKGHSNAPCAGRGFLYWYGGFEDYAVDQAADASFESQIEMPKKGEDLYVQAYVVLKDGSLLKGNVQRVHIP